MLSGLGTTSSKRPTEEKHINNSVPGFSEEILECMFIYVFSPGKERPTKKT